MWGGILLSLALAVCYVAPLHMFYGSRDDPRTVKARMACTSAYCCLAWIPVHLYTNPQGTADFLQLIGLRAGHGGVLVACLAPLATTAALFLGPLAMDLKDGLMSRLKGRYMDPMWRSAAAWRDLLVAPVGEEFVFRALMLAVLREAGLSAGLAILVAPLFFGVAHLHHVWDHVHHKGWPLSRALKAVVGQFLYTLVFGWLVSSFYIRYKHLLSCALPHMFCNLMGFPNFSAMHQHKDARHIVLSLYFGIFLFVLLLALQLITW